MNLYVLKEKDRVMPIRDRLIQALEQDAARAAGQQASDHRTGGGGLSDQDALARLFPAPPSVTGGLPGGLSGGLSSGSFPGMQSGIPPPPGGFRDSGGFGTPTPSDAFGSSERRGF